jgi:hypothetical protein
MVRGTEHQCSSMQLDGLIKVSQDTLPLESISKAVSKVAERPGPIKMARWTLL